MKLPPVKFTEVSLPRDQVLHQFCCGRCGAIVTHTSRRQHIAYHKYEDGATEEIVKAVTQLQRRT